MSSIVQRRSLRVLEIIGKGRQCYSKNPGSFGDSEIKRLNQFHFPTDIGEEW